jgi:hypothetical protein
LRILNILYYRFLIVILISFIITRCAIQVPPQGGPVDTAPPVVEESTPSNYAVLFDQTLVRINFNEYVTVNDINNQITISPIPAREPDFNLKGKSIQIDFIEKLKDSITYSINFGTAIRDYTVGNVLNNYRFVFSTGIIIDSCEIKGIVNDAFDLKPIEKCYVMLYDIFSDSIPLKEKPLYYARTDKTGQFEITNIRNGKYKIFALVDLNSNYMFDLPNETIAFLDTLVVSSVMINPIPINDTVSINPDSIKAMKTDTIKIRKDIALKDSISLDTAKLDSLRKSIALMESIRKDSLKNDSISKIKFYKLFMFQEKDTVQKLLKSNATESIKLTFIFRKGVKNLQIKPLNVEYDTVWKLEERSPTNDTIIYWLLKIKTDSLTLQVIDDGKIIDTTELRVGQTKVVLGKGSAVPTKFELRTNISSSGFDYYKPLLLNTPTPIKEYDLSRIKLLVKKDSLQDTLQIIPYFKDSIKKVLQIDYKWQEKANYTLFIPKGTFRDLHNNSNDTIIMPFKTKTYDDYGTLQINVILPDSSGNCNYIVQMLDDKEKVLSEKIILISGKNKYDYLNPGNYRIKVIKDSNGNGKWDSGYYTRKLQPEKVYYYPSIITIKAAWDITDLEVDLKKTDN